MGDVGSCLYEPFCNFQAVPLDCNRQGSLSLRSDCVGVCVEREKQIEEFEIAVKCNSHQSRLFGVLDERVVDYFWVLLE
jgi:hypothetical protein